MGPVGVWARSLGDDGPCAPVMGWHGNPWRVDSSTISVTCRFPFLPRAGDPVFLTPSAC